ncbi:NAC domain-containing protein JA2L-like [Apium graveolens]|uniref:NAC domain-containing protein JA2L-like n=1 Tax=Apium graveolens TaxID=4045 RepID=UPI003D791352
MGEDIKLPPGYRFYPKDEELISYYLKPKVLGQKLQCNFIDTVELYTPNSTPWQMFDVNSWMDSQNNLTERFIYVFTTLSKLRTSESSKATTSRSRDNTSKKAGCGTWAGKTNCKIRDCKGNVIGEKRLLVFEINDVGAEFELDKAGYFKMHEFSLSGINKGLKSAAGDLVLCRITFDSSKKPSVILPSISTAHAPKHSRECQIKNENLEGSVEVEENPESAGYLTSKSVVEMNNDVGDNVAGQSVAVGDNDLEGVENLASKSLVEMNNDVGDNVAVTECLTSENLCEIDNGFSDFDNYLVANYDQYNNSLLEFGEFAEDPVFDINWYNDFMISGQEDEQVEDSSSKLGKRKLEEENLYESNKKMCL